MPIVRIVGLTFLAMVAFAANSILCRMALADNGMDAASFTAIRLVSGALVLWTIVQLSPTKKPKGGDWWSALALFAYAAGFSFAYISLPTATGALLLFGAVQATMIGYGLYRGERLSKRQTMGLVVAISGLVGLMLPGLSSPPLTGAILMLAAGIAWGIYSLRGKNAGDPSSVTAGNFLRAAPIAVLLALFLFKNISVDTAGFLYAVASGALASGLGYSIWYAVLPSLKATNAATVQLSVPIIAAMGGILFLGEPLSLRLTIASVAILGGTALVISEKQHRS
jgi:drug/metabolite transporter (DMT)-like permease